MPSGTPIQHMEDYVFMNEKQITLHLKIERVGQFNTANVTRSWLGPFPAHTTGLHNFWDQVQNFLGYTDSFKKSPHGVLGSMPPSGVKLPKCETYCSFSVCPEQTDNLSNVKITPIVRILGIVTLIAKCPPDSLLSVRNAETRGASGNISRG